jgi:6-phosphogluconolactonase
MKSNVPEIYRDNKLDFYEFASTVLFEKFKKIQTQSSLKINIALSGGNTPLPILEILKNKKLNWERFNFFMVDERIVPLESPLSNFGNIEKVFFQYIISSKFSMVQTGVSYDKSINNYKDRIIENVPINENGFPEFDLILLGMGDDGHIASLFPGTKALIEDKEIVILNDVPQLDTERITITYPVILNAKEIVVVVKGNSKERIIRELYSGKAPKYPILKVVNLHSNLKWLIG